MERKVLIWDNFKLEDRGGQFGYLYQIHEFLKVRSDGRIVFLSDLIKQGHKEIKPESNEPHCTSKAHSSISCFIVRGLFLTIKKIRTFLKTGIFFGWTQFREGLNEIPDSIDLNEFSFIHFHWNPTASQFLHTHKEYKGKVILTSHCPCTWTDEHLTYFPPWVKWFRLMALYSECWTYKHADYLMFPCREAREAYEKVLPVRFAFKCNEGKFFYVPSSILDKQVDERSMQKYSEFGIPDGSFVITFFGRHNTIKGYDILERLGQELLDKYDNLYFLCAGRGLLEPIQHKRWIELGFIKNTHELLYQSDLYVLPNRETYFDLITLEVLRSGTKIIMSDTGGNKYFKCLDKSETIGIEYFDISNFHQLKNEVEKAIQEKKNCHDKYLKYGSSNRKLFLEYFTPETYVEEYLKSVESL